MSDKRRYPNRARNDDPKAQRNTAQNTEGNATAKAKRTKTAEARAPWRKPGTSQELTSRGADDGPRAQPVSTNEIHGPNHQPRPTPTQAGTKVGRGEDKVEGAGGGEGAPRTERTTPTATNEAPSLARPDPEGVGSQGGEGGQDQPMERGKACAEKGKGGGAEDKTEDEALLFPSSERGGGEKRRRDNTKTRELLRTSM